jgi:phosphoribosylformylglycinamidine (FGAM) synthase-like enzyme
MLYVIGETTGALGASLYARVVLGLKGEDAGAPPPVDLAEEVRIGGFVRSLIQRGLVNAVHDVSDGGIACAATEMAMASACGVTLVPDRDPETERAEPGLFGEDQGRYLIAANEDQVREWQSQGFLPPRWASSAATVSSSERVLGQDGAEFSVRSEDASRRL